MQEEHYASRDEASAAAAETIAVAVNRRLASQPAASLVVSGGTTPTRCFERLAHASLDWGRVHVLLSDERWVPADDASSNEQLVRTKLLQNGAAAAHLLPAYAPGKDIVTASAALDEAIRQLPFPFATALLGMGEDGHFASLFPDAPNLEEGLDVDSNRLVIPVSTAASPHPRVSLTLSALSRSDEIVLLFFGDAKRAVYEEARSSKSGYPVARLLRQKRAPVRVFWAP